MGPGTELCDGKVVLCPRNYQFSGSDDEQETYWPLESACRSS